MVKFESKYSNIKLSKKILITHCLPKNKSNNNKAYCFNFSVTFVNIYYVSEGTFNCGSRLLFHTSLTVVIGEARMPDNHSNKGVSCCLSDWVEELRDKVAPGNTIKL